MTLQRIPLCSFSRRLHLDTATDEYAVSQADLDSTHYFIYNSGKVTGTTSVSIYENPFRQIDVSSFPLGFATEAAAAAYHDANRDSEGPRPAAEVLP